MFLMLNLHSHRKRERVKHFPSFIVSLAQLLNSNSFVKLVIIIITIIIVIITITIGRQGIDSDPVTSIKRAGFDEMT